jgi:hypothetical protein
MSQVVHFQIEVTAIDKPTTRRRWNGDPMASAEASTALFDVVEVLRTALIERGFEPSTIGYGTTAERLAS